MQNLETVKFINCTAQHPLRLSNITGDLPSCFFLFLSSLLTSIIIIIQYMTFRTYIGCCRTQNERYYWASNIGSWNLCSWTYVYSPLHSTSKAKHNESENRKRREERRGRGKRKTEEKDTRKSLLHDVSFSLPVSLLFSPRLLLYLLFSSSLSSLQTDLLFQNIYLQYWLVPNSSWKQSTPAHVPPLSTSLKMQRNFTSLIPLTPSMTSPTPPPTPLPPPNQASMVFLLHLFLHLYFSSNICYILGLDVLLARKDIQAVIIALPILTQPDVIRKVSPSSSSSILYISFLRILYFLLYSFYF